MKFLVVGMVCIGCGLGALFLLVLCAVSAASGCMNFDNDGCDI